MALNSNVMLLAIIGLHILSFLPAFVSSQQHQLPPRLHRHYYAPQLLFTLIALSPPSSPSIISMASSSSSSFASAKKQKTHYDTLEIPQDATLKDIKKAYRRLAVQHHPDRNLGNEEAATIKFREISEAYEVLSDEDLRRGYDRSLKNGGGFDFGSFGQPGGSSGGGGGQGFKWSYGNNAGGGSGGAPSTRERYEQRREQRRAERNQRRRHRDPFEQFNTVFRDDPFFADAFKNMDDLFDKHFSENARGQQQQQRRQPSGGSSNDVASNHNEGGGGGGWLWNTVKDYLPNIDIQVTTSSSSGGQRSQTTRSYGNRRSSSSRGRSSASSGSSYSARSTRTVIQNGQRVTIQSLEKDGNKIEEKYIGEKLVERTINGMKEDVGRIERGSGGEF